MVINMNDEEVIKNEIEQAIAQVDNTLSLDTCEFHTNKETRALNAHFIAKSSSGDTVEVQSLWD